ncbi:dihydrodipicolinate synthetase [candidate division KSB1 bacterium]|nr:dihydrodipicolinate synthetase [candidate division KSB1 bacterium]
MLKSFSLDINKKLRSAIEMTAENRYDLIPAVFSPMSPDGEINLSAIESYAEYLDKNGMSKVFINGSTGESLSLTVDERKRIAEVWSRAASSKMKIIVHVGHNCLPVAKELARHTQKLNANYISAMAPNFFKPANIDHLIDFLKEIAAEAPDIPFYFYYMPAMSNQYLDMLEFVEKAQDRIPTFAGVKYTYENLLEYRNCIVHWGNKLDFLYGRDELLIHGLIAGANGSIGSNYNFIGPLYLKLVKAFRSGDMEQARLLADKTAALAGIVLSYGLLPVGKVYMKKLGVNCGNVRSPLQPISKNKFREFLNAVAELELDKL